MLREDGDMRSQIAKITAVVGTVCVGGLAICGGAAAQDGKPVTIVVGFGAGGAYHFTAVMLARHMPKHLPGKPNVIVQTKPGAGSIVATNYLAQVAPKDGTVLGVIGGGVVLEPLFGNEKAKFDPRTISWIGSVSTAVNLCTVWAETGVKSLDDIKAREVVAGSTGRGSRTYSYPAALNALFGTKFKILTGYKGLRQMSPALQKGEVQAICGFSWDGLRAQFPQLLSEKKLNFLAQFALTKGKVKEIAHVPWVQDLVKSQTDKKAVDLLVVDTEIAWPLVAPPGIPAGTLKMLRDAFDKTMKDPEFVAEMTKSKREVDPVPGAEIDKLMAQTFATPKDVIARARDISGL